jgi:hypothetical protein
MPLRLELGPAKRWRSLTTVHRREWEGENEPEEGMQLYFNTFKPCLLLRYFHPQKMWGYVEIWCSVSILSNLLKYSSPKILYHDEEFLI